MRGAPPILRFGAFELDLANEELRKFGTLIKLAPQPFQLLALLASQAGQIVTREQIQFQLWGDDTYVDFEQGMNHCIRQIRNALSDNAETPRYIETLPRRGYRFVAPVEVVRPVVEESLLRFPQESAGKPDACAPFETSGSHRFAVAVAPASTAAGTAPGTQLNRPGQQLPRGWVLAVLIMSAVIICAISAYWMFRERGAQRISSPTADVRHRKTVALLGFKNIGGHPDSGIPLSTALTTMLTTDLAAGDQLRVVPSAEVDALKRELRIGEADSLAPEVLRRIRKGLGADYVVTGSYMAEAGQVRVDVRVQDTATAENIASVAAKQSDSMDGLDTIVSDANARIRPKLGLPAVSDEEVSRIRATLPADPAAVYYYQGLGKLKVFDTLAARQLLEKALVAEPGFAPAHLALAEALNTLGYSKLARDEAEKAYRYSSELPQQQRLLIDARFRELTGKWEQAMALYQKLWDAGHNNVDYGLYLARAQTKSGKGKEALATVQALRALPQPETDDLRIDLEEANAYYALGEYDREQAAADNAVRKAEALGGSFALARARKAQGKALFYRGHFDEAIAMYRQSLAISQGLGDQGEIASSSNNIAGVLQEQGDLSAALELHAKALAAFGAMGNRESAAATMSNMGAVYQLQGELGQAMNMYRQALDVYRELGERLNESIVINNVAEVQFLSGDLGRAHQGHEQAIAIDRQIGNQSNEAEALAGLGQVLAAKGDLAGARRAQEKALTIRNQLQEEDAVQESRLALAALALEEGNGAEAEQSAANLANSFQAAKLREKQTAALILLARARLSQNKLKQAQEAQAQLSASGIQNRILLLDLQLASAQVSARSDDPTTRAGAAQKLLAIVSDAAHGGYLQLQMQATLALAQTELASGNTNSGLARLASLRKQAADRGFGLLARQAAAAGSHARSAAFSEATISVLYTRV